MRPAPIDKQREINELREALRVLAYRVREWDDWEGTDLGDALREADRVLGARKGEA